MMLRLKRSYAIMCCFFILSILLNNFPLIAVAEETTTLNGNVYIFEETDNYDLDSLTYNQKLSASDTTVLGSLSLNGNISKNYTKNGIAAYEIAEDTVFSLSYSYNSELRDADLTEWHLVEDSGKIVNGINLEDKILNGAIILQTSLDGNKWITDKIVTDLTTSVSYSEDNGINNIQLANGCFYRIIVAYKTQIQLNDKSFLGFDTSDYEYHKNAEVYEFYASYKDTNTEPSGKQHKYYVGTENGNSITCRTKSSDYMGSEPIDSTDSHYGWNLGFFVLSGFTDTGDSNDVYLKNVGNRIKLTFKLNQDINCINGNSDLVIENVKNGCDGSFGRQAHNMGRGELIIRHIDEEGTPRTVEYSNYLEALTFPSAETIVQLFEEGDYEVHLDYAITNKHGIDSTTYYRTAFSFKIRNGNCMVYIFDALTGSELSNCSVTENGFKIDSAKSGYQKYTVKREVLNSTGNALDIRYNKSATAGDSFTDEGIYTITASNRFNSSMEPSVKTIYIGNNALLTAYTKNLNKTNPYTIAQLNNLVEEGYTITKNGEIIEPVIETTTTTISRVTETTSSTITTTTTVETTSPDTETTITTESNYSNSTLPYFIGGIGGMVGLGGIVAIAFSKKRKTGGEAQ